ncbi:oxidoreductase, 2OG-Fe(II) oxygenase family [Purpureocillium lilacinum]|uniref:Oxidoreductase, 2OG-Fe(II) oxygenase family n=1 Tax=Purpureocillium lilacinum TaxID=33203 RepID=A0A179H666_PURLI|nr:oxidoreductase, 2OG-Fe(II) oxygenase family [Purpureocillium lilacinum]OAQ85647.1 oxidoreductase, 2OG-Fe(II) oxygenase family [Purpureocillium lilacinum]
MPPATANIPVIDLAGDEADVARQLVAAAEEHGFIYIKNRGNDIPAAAVDEAFSLSRRIFDTPLEEKQRCSIQTNNRGWTGMHAETLDPKNQRIGDFKEAFNFGEFVDGKAQQPIPSTIAAEEARFAAFADSCRRLCHKILYLLGLGLDVGDFFSSAHFTTQSGSGTILRFLRYPPADAASASADVRAGAHSDYGSITLLFRLPGQAGLEVLRRDNVWAPVPVSPPGTAADPSPPILVNIGDLLSYWTNGLFRSTVHRVVFPAEGSGAAVEGESSAGPRYSIAFFCHPVGTTRLEPVPSQKVKDYVPAGEAVSANPYAERKVMTADEHLFMRLKESYGTLYDEKKEDGSKS